MRKLGHSYFLPHWKAIQSGLLQDKEFSVKPKKTWGQDRALLLPNCSKKYTLPRPQFPHLEIGRIKLYSPSKVLWVSVDKVPLRAADKLSILAKFLVSFAQLISSCPQTLWFTQTIHIPLDMLTGGGMDIWPNLASEPFAGSIEKKKFSFCWEPSGPHREEAFQRMRATQREAEQVMFKDKFPVTSCEYLHEFILSFNLLSHASYRPCPFLDTQHLE